MSSTDVTESAQPNGALDAEPATPTETSDAESDLASDASLPDEVESPAPDVATDTRRLPWMKLLAFGIVPIVALLLAAGSGYVNYRDFSIREADVARTQSVQAASDGAVALLSYGPDDVEAKLTAAQDRLTGTFRDSYASLTKDVVIPGAKQQHISATATVPAAASMSASSNHAEVMVFVNQAIIVGNDAPTETASAVEVTLDKLGTRWLISGFEPK